VNVGDLVRVTRNFISENAAGTISIVLEMNKSENHPNGLGLVKVLENGQEQWYPIGYIEVINECR
jgi:hypothetical protein